MNLEKTKTHFILTGISKCETCEGTGLYKGFAEQDGARVICYRCNGSGQITINQSFSIFKGRQKDKLATRVYINGMGYGITDKDITTEKGIFMPFSKYGCSYQDWLNGKEPIPLKFLGCPYRHTNQSLQIKDVNDLYETRCKENLGWGNITDCKLYYDKQKCWEIFGQKRKGND